MFNATFHVKRGKKKGPLENTKVRPSFPGDFLSERGRKGAEPEALMKRKKTGKRAGRAV